MQILKFGRIYTPERKRNHNITLNEVYTPLPPVLSGFTLVQSAGEHGVEVRGGCCYYVPELLLFTATLQGNYGNFILQMDSVTNLVVCKISRA